MSTHGTMANSNRRRRGKGRPICWQSVLLVGIVACACFGGSSSNNHYYCSAFSTTPTNNNAKSSAASTSDAASKVSSTSNNQQLQIAFVTGNKMKARELNMILEEATGPLVTDDSLLSESSSNNAPDDEHQLSSSSLVNLRIINVDLPEIQEVNTEAIAKEKALLGAQLAGGPCVVEDTSLQFTALGGMPGPYIKWFQQRLGSRGLFNILSAYDDKSAQAVCTLAFCPAPHADPVLFTGITHGQIVEPVEGRGFGWDSIFIPDAADQEEDGAPRSPGDIPFSCMTTAEKNQRSHRGKAVRKWAAWLKGNQQELLERQGGRPAIGHKGLDFKCSSVEE